MKKIIAYAAIAAIGLLAHPGESHAQAATYPNKPIRLIVPFAAGQGADAAARVVAQKLSENLKQTVIIDNRPGAGGNIGANAVAKSAPDGYTLLVGSNGTHAANAALYQSMTFDPIKDFEPIVYIGSVPMVLVASPSSKNAKVADAISTAKSNPGKVTVGIPSSTARVVLELLQNKSQAEFKVVPYKASAAATSELIGGHVDLLIDTVIAAAPLVSAGTIKALAVSSSSRSGAMKDVPTLAESGLPGFDLVAWNVWLAPAGTDPAIVSKLNSEIVKVLADEDVKRQLRGLGYEPGGNDNAAKVAAFIRAETDKWGQLIRQAGIVAE